MHKSFGYLASTSDFHEVIELKYVKVYIVGHRKYFDWRKAAAYGSPVVGYANRRNDIYILGKRVGNRIVINQAVLGHELNHLLNFEKPDIANPDELDDLGL